VTDAAGNERPVLWGQVGPAASFALTSRATAKVALPARGRQRARLDAKFQGLDSAFAEQVAIAQSLGASDPELVLVFEAIDERIDLLGVAERLGLEILTEVDREFDPDPDFPRKSVQQDLPVTGCLHALCINRTAMISLLGQWSRWRQTGSLQRGYTPLRDLFAHLRDVRPWGPQDRIRMTSLINALDGMLPGDHEIEIELWYRLSEELRQKAEREVAALISASGGQVLASSTVPQVGYHGMKCLVPLELLRRLTNGDFDAITAVKSSHVMYLRAGAQSYTFSDHLPATAGDEVAYNLPSGDPVLCVLDGVPVANHPRLAGRVVITDPDDLAADTATDTLLRRHGTAMTSICVWGDLSAAGPPAARPVLVRPILAPAPATQEQVEELRPHDLAPDLMRRIFRELYDGDGTTNPIGQSIVVINLSVGDPAAPFDGVLSAWARTLDWLSASYGVLVIVSAGNHGSVTVASGAHEIAALTGTQRAQAVNRAVTETFPRRSLIGPGDSINALTVGALNSDAAGPVTLGYRIDAGDGQLIINPVSALGAGYKRSVKPDLVAHGGRAYFHSPLPGGRELVLANQMALGPGIKVAGSDGHSERYTMGTSPAAALVSAASARVVDAVAGLAGRPLTRAEIAVGTKALVAHSGRIPTNLLVHDGIGRHAHGYGSLERSYADGCAEHEATILFIGQLGASQESQLLFPIPDGLQQTGVKTVTVTLAWLSPVNWRHRQYRCAALDFAKPRGFTDLGTPLDISANYSKQGTIQHAVWQIDRAVPAGVGDDMVLTVRCKEQAGGLHGEHVDYAVVMTLEVAPELHVDVYNQVRQQVTNRIPISPR
jgi:hypothetical protein